MVVLCPDALGASATNPGGPLGPVVKILGNVCYVLAIIAVIAAAFTLLSGHFPVALLCILAAVIFAVAQGLVDVLWTAAGGFSGTPATSISATP